MKTYDLEGAKLDYWVGKALGPEYTVEYWGDHPETIPFQITKTEWRTSTAKLLYPGQSKNCSCPAWHNFMPTLQWGDMGWIIEQERISIEPSIFRDSWTSVQPPRGYYYSGPTPLIAACRCFVGSVFGEEVPDEILDRG